MDCRHEPDSVLEELRSHHFRISLLLYDYIVVSRFHGCSLKLTVIATKKAIAAFINSV